MSKREIASLVIKLMGVFILLKSISYVPMVYSGISYAFQSQTKPDLLQTLFILMMSTGTALIPLGFSVLIIVLSDKAASWLIKEDGPLEYPQNSVSSKEEIMTVAVSCIGLFFIVASVPTLISGLINAFQVVNRQTADWFSGHYRMTNIFRQMIAPGVQIALGTWLFVGSKGIVKFWKKIRS